MKIKPLLYSFLGLLLLVSLAGWIFFTHYFEDTLNRYAVPRLTEAARVGTHGKYRLTMGRISYSGHSVFCKNFVLSRAGYDSSEHGNTLKRISIDSVRFIGVSWWDALWGNDMRMTSIELNAPKIYLADVEKERGIRKNLPMDTSDNSFTVSKKLPVISFDSIVLHGISVFFPDRAHAGDEPSLKDIELKLTNFRLDSKTYEAQPLLYSERVDFSMPGASYPLSCGDYSLEFRSLRGSFSDSTLEIDTLAYHPLFSEQAFAARHRYIQPRTDLQCFNLKFNGINFVTMIAGTNLTFRTCTADSWSLDSYTDKRKPTDPHPTNPAMPNDFVRTITLPINMDSVIFKNGNIHWGERWPGSIEPGTLTFSDARIAVSPFCTDTLNSHFAATTQISFSALFLDAARLQGVASYPLHSKSLNYNIDATLGAFSAKKLNSELIPIERMEVTDGTVTHGTVHINVRDGLATTTVTPQYHDLSIKVLSKDVKKSRSIMDGIKTFLANTFAIRSNNIDKDGTKAMSATTTLRRTKDEEFLQFTWFALRKSLGKVVGFTYPQ